MSPTCMGSAQYYHWLSHLSKSKVVLICFNCIILSSSQKDHRYLTVILRFFSVIADRAKPSLGTTSVLHAPVCHPFVHSLDSILSEFNPIYQLSRDCLSDSPTSADIESLLHRAQAVEREFATWHQQQAAEWRPQYFDPSDTSNFHDIGNVPGPWHTYFDRMSFQYKIFLKI